MSIVERAMVKNFLRASCETDSEGTTGFSMIYRDTEDVNKMLNSGSFIIVNLGQVLTTDCFVVVCIIDFFRINLTVLGSTVVQTKRYQQQQKIDKRQCEVKLI